MEYKKHIVFKAIRKLLRSDNYTEEYVEIKGQNANDFVYESINHNSNGLMVSKFGTTEMSSLCCYLANRRGLKIRDWIRAVHDEYSVFPDDACASLCINSGFFPEDLSLWEKYVKLVLKDISYIDILASYQKSERYLGKLLNNPTKIDLEGYYAPFMWDKPWTRCLKGKKVLVIHPFVDSIYSQYMNNRSRLFDNPDVLPEFDELILIKAVQSISGNGSDSGFDDWFQALKYMENQIDKVNFDVAIIGCGAYGMNLAAYVKRKGKIAIHMAGWTQMLFGVYGNRWLVDQPEFSKYINKYWVRPDENERPAGLEKVENGCYW